jgi:SH3-like domain-containing protein
MRPSALAAPFAALSLTFLIMGVDAAQAQSGTLQVPSQANNGAAASAPTPRPRQPDRKPGPSPATPVVPAHGPSRPHKPLPKNEKAATAAHAGKLPANAPPPTKPGPETGGAPPAPPPGESVEKETGAEKAEGNAVKLPRFASLRSDDVNMRVGPGTRYRIDWVYKRRDLPVEIEREYDVWRWVRDSDGNHGWVHQATLMGRRSFIVQNADAALRSDPNETAAPVAILKVGVIGRIRSCDATSDWCNVQAGSYRGYLRRQQFWGVFPGEAVTP